MNDTAFRYQKYHTPSKHGEDFTAQVIAFYLVQEYAAGLAASEYFLPNLLTIV